MIYVAHRIFLWAALFRSVVLPTELCKDALDILFLVLSAIRRAARTSWNGDMGALGGSVHGC